MKKRHIVGGIIAATVILGTATACDGSGGSSKDPVKPATSVSASASPGKSKAGKEAAEKKDVAVFKVWGSAPSGVSITYGSDGTNLQGKGLPMTKELKVEDDALYYQVTAQLQGGGDIYCSVTVNGKTKQGHAQGGYNICSAQLNGGLTGW